MKARDECVKEKEALPKCPVGESHSTYGATEVTGDFGKPFQSVGAEVIVW